MIRSQERKAAVRRLARWPVSRAGKSVAAVAAAVAALAAGLGVAAASTSPAVRPSGPPSVVVQPATSVQPGALAIAEPQPGAHWMGHPLLVAVHRWQGTRGSCPSPTQPLADTQSASTGPAGCGTPQLTTAAVTGYSPLRLRAYLRLRGTGQGQRVVIVGAFDNPYARQDLSTFSKRFRLPLPCGTPAGSGCIRFSVAHPFGFAGVDAGWALESDLDVQMVHAVAPNAAITLVESYDNSFTSMLQAVGYAAALKPAPAAISGSWGGAEFPQETTADWHCALARTVCLFSTGDLGNPGEWPAYDPYALAVGGTHLELTTTGRVATEEGWCCDPQPGGATGGGVSIREPRPAYQQHANPYRHRSIPDVSFDADPATGVPVHDTFGVDGQNGWFEVGGTSVGAPAWAGLLAVADQLREAAGIAPLAGARFQVQRLLYGMPHRAGFGDITQGADNLFQCTSPVRACQAHPGYDLVTGWGSPRPGIDTALARAG
jgi:subtilase family serine protease